MKIYMDVCKKKLYTQYEFVKMHTSLFFMCVIAINCLFFIFWGTQKDCFFIDEFYTLEGASKISEDDDRLRWNSEANFYEDWHTSKEFLQHISVDNDEWLLKKSFVEAMSLIFNGRNLHYSLVNLVGGFFQNQFLKWPVICFNMFVFIIIQIIYYCIAEKIFQNRFYSIITVFVYGISVGAISTVLYMRFYILYVLACLVLLYLHMILLDTDKNRTFITIGIIMTLYLGYKNSEYMLIFTFLVSVSYLIFCLFNKKFKYVVQYFLIFLISFILWATVYFQNFISWLNEDGQAKVAIQNILEPSAQESLFKLKSYFNMLNNMVSIKLAILLLLPSLILFICKKRKINMAPMGYALALLAISGVYILIISCISPWDAWRYISNTFPMLILLVMIFCFKIYSSNWGKSISCIFYIIVLVESMIVDGSFKIPVLHDGPSTKTKEMLECKYEGINSIYFYSGERGELYYNAFLWVPNTLIYVTTKDTFITTQVEEVIKDNNEVLIWVEDEENWLQVKPIIEDKLGFAYSEYVMDTGGGRYNVYMSVRQ